MTTRPHIRCAIYTRKSTDDGLEQGFNSLDAQYEACAAYIASQRHEGWRLLPARYDDGGLSGGTLDRPALQQLLCDVDAGRVGMVVVYKIDRLTRSLADFAKLVERLDAANCSFVSVTQAFNTSSSMGRLTLNVLLSFAQFEREVTAERIRDKIAASKKKGLWMGGTVPLGYDPHPDTLQRSLVPNPDEAVTVQTLFELYERGGSLVELEATAKAQGLISKRRVAADGTIKGGQPLSRGQLHYLLTNPVYRGKIRHKAEVHPGQHPAIIDEALWQRVQDKLQQASQRSRQGAADPAVGDLSGMSSAPLTGLLRDETGDRLTPSHTRRKGRLFRYYISNRFVSGGTDPTGWRLPAAALEQAVLRIILSHLETAAQTHAILAVPDATTAVQVSKALLALASTLRAEGTAALSSLLSSAQMAPPSLHLQLAAPFLAQRMGLDPQDLAPTLLDICAPFQLRRRGVETRIAAGQMAPRPDPALLRVLAHAHLWMDRLRAGTPLAEVARDAGHSEAYIRTRAPLAFLAPSIQSAILAGTQPPDLTLARIVRTGVPLDWDAQAKLFGVA